MAFPRQINSILVYVGLDLVGDGLIKLPFVRALRDTYPNARITWLAGKDKSVFNGVLKNVVTGLIDEVIERTDIGVSWSEIFPNFWRNPLPGRAFDLIIDTQKGALASVALRRIRHGAIISPFANFAFSSRRPPAGYKFPKNLQRQLFDLLEIASGAKYPTPTGLIVPIDAAFRDLATQLTPSGPTYVGLAPGAGGIQKCWPLEKFIELAQAQVVRGRIPVFILGPAEAGWDFKIREAVPAAKFPLQENEIGVRNGFAPELTIALANRMAVCVANDSGTGHMCAISGAAMVSLFGRTTPDKFMPMARRIVIVRAQDFGGREMALIPMDAVARAVDAMLA